MSNFRPGQVGYNSQRGVEQEVVEKTVYTNPVVHSGYDPDGLQELFSEDYIDWDAFEWDSWNWVVNQPEGDGDDDDGDDAPLPVGSVQDGADINFEYYQQDPLYQMAFANMAANDDDFDVTDLSLDDLQEATKTIVETYRSVMGDKYRPPWKQDLPDKYVPTRMKTDYQTPFKVPQLVHAGISPIMGTHMRDLKKRSGAWHEDANRKLQAVADANPQPGFKQPEGARSSLPTQSGESGGVEATDTQKRWRRNVKEIIGKDQNWKDWAAAAGVDNLNSRSDSDKIKKFYREHGGVLPG